MDVLRVFSAGTRLHTQNCATSQVQYKDNLVCFSEADSSLPASSSAPGGAAQIVGTRLGFKVHVPGDARKI